jgi:hypothetical protein
VSQTAMPQIPIKLAVHWATAQCHVGPVGTAGPGFYARRKPQFVIPVESRPELTEGQRLMAFQRQQRARKQGR